MNNLNAEKFLGQFTVKAFSPIAYYDKHLDCIRVEIRDCSVTEHRCNELFTVLEDNYPEQEQQIYVGFTIKGVKHLFESLNLETSGIQRVTDILQKIVTANPDLVMGVAMDQMRPLLLETELEVDFAQAA